MAKKTDIPPTVEELDDNINKAIDELDTPEDEESQEDEEEAEDVEPEEEAEKEPESEEQEEAPEETPEPEEDLNDEEVEPSKEIYKKKFKESSKENQKIYSKNRIINEAVKEASELKPPTDEEMAKTYGEDWEMLGDFEKRMARDNYLNNKRFELVQEASAKGDKIEKWNDKVKDYIEDPKTLNDFPQLEGKSNEFKEFATKDEYNGIPMDILVPAFLHNQPAKTKNKGKMMESGSTGRTAPNKNVGKITFEEGQKLRESNYNKYKELLVSGKILDPQV